MHILYLSYNGLKIISRFLNLLSLFTKYNLTSSLKCALKACNAIVVNTYEASGYCNQDECTKIKNTCTYCGIVP